MRGAGCLLPLRAAGRSAIVSPMARKGPRVLRQAFLMDNARGATYLFVMLAVVLMGLALSVAARQWKTVVQREQEAELLFRGIEIRTAIAAYSAEQVKGRIVPGARYPQSLQELTMPPKPFLRQVYSDPLTGEDWDYLRDPAGRIMGVRSRSKEKPIKRSNFPPAASDFEGATSYGAWVFYVPAPSIPSGLPAPSEGVPPNVPAALASPTSADAPVDTGSGAALSVPESPLPTPSP